MWGLRSQRRAQEGVSVTLLTSIASPPPPPFHSHDPLCSWARAQEVHCASVSHV